MQYFSARGLLLCFLIMLAFACSKNHGPSSSSLKAGGRQIGHYKGYVAIDQILRTRMLEAGDDAFSFAITRYLSNDAQINSDLAIMLGGFSSANGRSEFINGVPNAMNMLLWQKALSGLAGSIAASCGTDGHPILLDRCFRYSASFAAGLRPLCSWPAAAAKTEQSLQGLWLGIMGYDAPKAEYEAWRNSFLDPASPFANADQQVTLKAMIRGIVLSPYFLLEH